jgi:hypothetical protein
MSEVPLYMAAAPASTINVSLAGVPCWFRIETNGFDRWFRSVGTLVSIRWFRSLNPKRWFRSVINVRSSLFQQVDATAESEALTREMINRIQRLKKTTGIVPADGPSTSISLRVAPSPGAPALLDAPSLHGSTLLAAALGRVPLLVVAGGAWEEEGEELVVGEEVIVVGGENVVVEIRVVKLRAPLRE